MTNLAANLRARLPATGPHLFGKYLELARELGAAVTAGHAHEAFCAWARESGSDPSGTRPGETDERVAHAIREAARYS